MIRQRGAFGDVPFEASTPANPHPFGPGPSPNASALGASGAAVGRQSGETNSFLRHAPVLPAIYPAETHATVHEEHGELIAVPEHQADTTGDEYIKVSPEPAVFAFQSFCDVCIPPLPLPPFPDQLDAGGPYMYASWDSPLPYLLLDPTVLRCDPPGQCSRTATLTFLSSSWHMQCPELSADPPQARVCRGGVSRAQGPWRCPSAADRGHRALGRRRGRSKFEVVDVTTVTRSGGISPACSA